LLGVLVRRPLRLLVCLLLLTLFGFGLWLGGSQVWAWYHFRAGRSAVERYHHLDAMQHLAACLRIWPNDPDALVLAARTARRLDALDQAEAFLQRAQGMKRNYDPVLERLLLRAARGELDQVEKVCQDRVEQNDPNTSLILEALVAGALRAFRMRYAENCLERWLELEPENPQAIFYRGVLFEFRGARQEAAASYRRALECDAEFDPARLSLALQLRDLLRSNEAVPHLEYLLTRDPGNLRIPVYLAQCKDQLGQQAEAEAILDDVLTRDPDFAPALAERGKMALDKGQLELAERLLSKAAKHDLGDYSIHYRLYQCLTQLGRTQEADALQQRLKQIETDILRLNDIVHTQMAQSPRDVALHYEAGMIALRAGSFREGLRWFDSALQIEPKHAPTHRALAEFYQKTGQIGEAQKHWETAKAVDPEGTIGQPPMAVPK
jgi:tetratricopeptide (TPR) repeat protein